ncbi:MAG: ATP-binding protein [Chitinophagales bacterium]|nr:ATP-binding protein [Chitinophagales bacterium]MDW8427736.1 ATP-binding protein [Chitinophagales bacterium]
MAPMKSYVVFYALIIYIFISFCWWFVLLLRINNERYAYREALLRLQAQSYPPDQEAVPIQVLEQQLERDRKRQFSMIVGEGTVFLVILILITLLTHRSMRLEAQVLNRQKNFLLAVTHELKSPLAAIKVAVQTMQRHTGMAAHESQQLQAHALAETERLEALVNNLLLAARLDAHSHSFHKQPCELVSLLRQQTEVVQHTLGRHHVIRFVANGPVSVVADPQAINSIIHNLLDNAIKYAPVGSVIEVFVGRQENQAVLKVTDQGPGIPPQERKLVFEKFYRRGQEETRLARGTGLGLFIVKKLVALHGGMVSVAENKPTGCIFTVLLPTSTDYATVAHEHTHPAG